MPTPKKPTLTETKKPRKTAIKKVIEPSKIVKKHQIERKHIPFIWKLPFLIGGMSLILGAVFPFFLEMSDISTKKY
jgi:hypothetical protein